MDEKCNTIYTWKKEFKKKNPFEYIRINELYLKKGKRKEMDKWKKKMFLLSLI